MIRLRFLADLIRVMILVFAVTLTAGRPDASAGMLRINVNDGRSIEVPYYWEEHGEIKFEFAGGIAGVPKGQVSSIQEVLTAKEFDPEVLIEAPREGGAGVDPGRRFKDFIVKQLPHRPDHETLSPEEGLAILQAESLTRNGSKADDPVYGPLYNLEASFSELVRLRGQGVLLVLQNVLSSRTELKDQAFTLIAYDGEGHVLQRKPCEIHKIAIDRKEKKQYEIPGHLYTLIATIKPDSRIKRFEIVSARK